MFEIDFEERKIKLDGKWVTEQDMIFMIQEKMENGDMQFAEIAAALEEFNVAFENSKEIDISIILPTEDYEKLLILGNGDEKTAVRKAIEEFINVTSNKNIMVESEADAEKDKKKKTLIKCFKCQAPIELFHGQKTTEIQCPKCMATGHLKPEKKEAVKYQDHYLG
jgi:DNA-directed RNA polymerase subunit RPC12/RpoP